MEQDCGPLFIIDWNFEEFRVQCHDLERKIRRGVSLAMADVIVPPVVSAAKDRQVFQDESLTGETLLGQHSDSILNFFALVRFESKRTDHERSVQNHQGY